MPRIAYVNGRYLPLSKAAVSVTDRGFQFADSVYEVIGLRDRRLLDCDGHLARLARSLGEIGMALPLSLAALGRILAETIRRNRLEDGLVYLQITRGSAPRDHAFPVPASGATLVVVAKPYDWAAADARSAAGIAVITRPDLRWRRCDIKTTALLPNVLAKQMAKEAGAQEVWFVDDEGRITEGASSNAWIVTAGGRVVTRALGHAILPGITRARFLGLVREQGLVLEERAFTPQEALEAAEAFITGATNIATAVVRLDGRPVGTGVAGTVTRVLRAAYWRCNN